MVLLALSACHVSGAGPLPCSGCAPAYRDLNRNGARDAYEDAALTPALRARDLLDRMTLEEKVGQLVHGTLPGLGSPMGASSAGYDLASARRLIADRHISSFITRLSMSPREFAEQNNAVQRIAASTRLGIPLTISTDPRNHFQATLGASSAAGRFSLWPEPLGFGALGDPERVRRFASIVRREYRAVGIGMALSPQADLATEPRWPRISGTFGADAVSVSRMVGAYVEGMQATPSGVSRNGVAVVVKHWIGYGAARDGFDGHNHYGRDLMHSNDTLLQHKAAFAGAFRARVAAVMPTYGIIRNVTHEGEPLAPVGAGFNRVVLGPMLREEAKFDGLVISDWGIARDCPKACRAPDPRNPQTPATIGMPWGLEGLSSEDRIAVAISAGVDQLGGEDDPAPILSAVRQGKIAPARIDEAVLHVLVVKFRLGLFDNPYADPDAAEHIVGNPAFLRAGLEAQRDAMVLLENRNALLPLRGRGKKMWAFGVALDAVKAAGFKPVDTIGLADVAIIRMKTPSDLLHPHHFFGRFQAEGRLDFRDGDPGYDALKRVEGKLPVIVAIDMDRPAILANVAPKATGLIAVFGASDAALLDVISGRATAKGRLPLNLPSATDSVARQHPAVGDDDELPLYRRGYGLSASGR
ncbi:MAG TPA: glycoside hydrolase family 3 N-terminal domain-containing protein [Sphingomonas sp.]|nr:glycoside hydrolase family 3 N-terminal domain-containing protein [Sphingomonas sp.]